MGVINVVLKTIEDVTDFLHMFFDGGAYNLYMCICRILPTPPHPLSLRVSSNNIFLRGGHFQYTLDIIKYVYNTHLAYTVVPTRMDAPCLYDDVNRAELYRAMLNLKVPRADPRYATTLVEKYTYILEFPNYSI